MLPFGALFTADSLPLGDTYGSGLVRDTMNEIPLLTVYIIIPRSSGWGGLG